MRRGWQSLKDRISFINNGSIKGMSLLRYSGIFFESFITNLYFIYKYRAIFSFICDTIEDSEGIEGENRIGIIMCVSSVQNDRMSGVMIYG